MVMVYSHGQMEDGMKENIKTIKNKVTVLLLGQMAGNTLVDGIMGSNMAKVPIYQLMALRSLENGQMASV